MVGGYARGAIVSVPVTEIYMYSPISVATDM